MSTYTANYQLHQWEPQDHFLRTDFNEDHAKIDAGIHGAHQAALTAQNAANRVRDALVPVTYNVYNLALQNYYDNKRTDFKRALMFDGFLNDAQIAQRNAISLVSGQITTGAGGLQPDITGSFYSTMTARAILRNSTRSAPSVAQDFKLVGYGTMKTATLHFSSLDTASPCQGNLTVELVKNPGGGRPASNPVSVAQATLPLSGFGEQTYTYTLNAGVIPGDYAILVYANGLPEYASYYLDTVNNQDPLYFRQYYVEGGGGGGEGAALQLALAFDRTAPAGGYILSTPYNVGDGLTGARAWVRHHGTAGLVLSLVESSGAVHPMTAVEVRNTMNLQMQFCQETSFSLSKALSGPLKVRLEMSCAQGGTAVTYDYGVVLI